MELNRLKIRGVRLSSRRMMAACTDGIRITGIGGMNANYTTLGDICVFSLSNFLRVIETNSWHRPALKDIHDSANDQLALGIDGHSLTFVP